MELMSGFNPQQQQAVLAGLGPVLVVAGPGSGKTSVLTHRISYLISRMGVRPYHILAVTFTNKAAREMENRVTGLLGVEPGDPQQRNMGMPQVGTFHSTCARLLRREAEHLPFDANFVIFDADDQVALVKRSILEMNIDEKRYRAQGVHASISNAKNELLLPDDYPVQTYRDEVVKRVYQRYQQLLLTNNAVDFDDLLLWTAFLLEENTTVREKYARRFEHVLVDEFQDTNQAQYQLLKHLASFHHNLFVVGDTDQSIYAWRGADYRNVLRFEKDYPDAQVILLEQNYRSTQAILDVAMAVIDRNPHRHKKQLFTERGAGSRVTLHETYDDRSEAAFVVDTVASLVASQQRQPGDFAVMYRTNAQSRVLEEAFLHANLPYRLVGAQRFYGRREIKDMIAYLRTVHNPSDELSLTRILNVPTRGIGDKTILSLRTLAKKRSQALGATLLDLSGKEGSGLLEGFTGRAQSALANFSNLLSAWRGMATDQPPLALLDRILADVEYRSYIDDGTDEGNDRWENVMELRRLAAEYRERSLSEFLEEIALVSDQDTLDANTNAPTLLTLHAAKGLEFPVVFIVGLVDGTLPHMRSLDDPDGMEEERRLLYVGITRAKDRLFLVVTQSRSAFGYQEPCDPSRFLQDIPDEMLEQTARRTYGGRPVTRLAPAAETWSSMQATNHAPLNQSVRYPAGTKVTHPIWGSGIVLNSRLQDDDEIVDVFFDNMGLKRVVASLAHLEIKL
jgi:DNA helicase II / ATP-dependent DNA helicase PcrA